MKTIRLCIAAVFGICVLFASCDNNWVKTKTDFLFEEKSGPSSAKAITGFSFPGLSGTVIIDDTAMTISVTVPNGTSVTSRTPTVTHTGASYTPTGAQDFTSPVSYTVMATDGTTAMYTVTVTVLTVSVLTTINNQAELAAIAGNLNGNYVLNSNITLTTPAPGTSNWTPIGNDYTPFTGTFDGNNKTISNLTINNTAANYQGLFGCVGSGGTVEKVVLSGGSISAKSYVGGVVGRNYGTVKNSHTSGNVSGTGDNVGGVVGSNNGMVENCYATGNVSSTTGAYVGGVVGGSNGTVRNCYATGDVSGNDLVGGVVGFRQAGSGLVQYCYATGNVSSNSRAGGVLGSVGPVQCCVALNLSITCPPPSAGFAGRVMLSGSAGTDNYARNDMLYKTNSGDTGTTTFPSHAGTTSGKDGANVTAGTSSGQYNDQYFWETTLGWDFGAGGIWQMSGGANSLPIFQ